MFHYLTPIHVVRFKLVIASSRMLSLTIPRPQTGLVMTFFNTSIKNDTLYIVYVYTSHPVIYITVFLNLGSIANWDE